MSANETFLIMLMENLSTKEQRTLMLEKYVLRFGGVSRKAWDKIRELLEEAEER